MHIKALNPDSSLELDQVNSWQIVSVHNKDCSETS